MKRSARLSKVLGKKIQRQRKKMNLTQEELAEKVGISRAYMGYIEQGRNIPSLEVLHKIAKNLNISLREIL